MSPDPAGQKTLVNSQCFPQVVVELDLDGDDVLPSQEWRLYLDGQKSPVFQDHPPPRETIPETTGHHHRPDPVQLQPEESIGNSPVFSDLPDLDSFTSSDLAFLKSL